MADDRSVSREPHEGRGGHSGSAERVLHRRRERRRVEDDRLRPHLESDLRRSADRLDRRDRGRAVESEHHLRRAAAKDCSVPISRPATASTSPPTPARPGRTSACATASRFRRSSSIRAIRIASSSRCWATRTVRTPSADCSARPTAERRFRKSYTRTRTPARSTSCSIPSNPRHRLLRALGSAAGSVGERRVLRSRQRTVQVDRRRRHVAEDSARACRRSSRTDSAASASRWRRACRSRMFATVERDAERRALSLGRRRRELVLGDDRHARGVARVGLRRGEGRSEESGHRLHGERRHVEVDRRRQDVQGVSRRAGRRRLSPHLDQPEQSEHDPDRQRSGRDRHGQRRRDVELVVQPADRVVLSRVDGQRVSLSRLQRPAGVRLGVRAQPRRRRAHHCSRTGIRSASRSTATSRPIRSTPTSSTAARSRATTGARAKSSRSVRASARGGGATTIARCAPRRSSSRPSIRTRCSSRRTSCGRR